jgi:hypothetical protein
MAVEYELIGQDASLVMVAAKRVFGNSRLLYATLLASYRWHLHRVGKGMEELITFMRGLTSEDPVDCM